MRRTIPTALAVLAIALPAAAQQAGGAAAVSHPPAREEAAWNAAAAIQGNLLPQGQHATFMVLAWHAGIASLCPALVLDHERFGAAWATLEHADVASLSDAEHAYFRHHLAVSFGVAVGIMLAELAGTHDEIAAHCADALALARDPEGGTVFDAEAIAAAAE